MFYLIAGVIVCTQIPFILTARAEPAVWTMSREEKLVNMLKIQKLGEVEEKEKLKNEEA